MYGRYFAAVTAALLLTGTCLDVVEARREDWSTDPFELVEKDGHFFRRGTHDMKNGDAIMMASLIRLKKEGFRRRLPMRWGRRHTSSPGLPSTRTTSVHAVGTRMSV
jgi:acetylornithine deacetylase/succinyl-diaminopimelate desuccinylase-like protein